MSDQIKPLSGYATASPSLVFSVILIFMQRTSRGGDPILFKVRELRMQLSLLEEEETHRFMLFAAFGGVSLLMGVLGLIYILSSGSIDPMDVPALYVSTALFLGTGILLIWNGVRSTPETRHIEETHRRLQEMEQHVFMQEMDGLGQ